MFLTLSFRFASLLCLLTHFPSLRAGVMGKADPCFCHFFSQVINCIFVITCSTDTGTGFASGKDSQSQGHASEFSSETKGIFMM